MSSKKTHLGVLSNKLIKTERRQWIRYSSGVEVTCRLLGTGEDHSWSGEIQDVSAMGAGLVCSCAFERGAMLEVQPLYRVWNFGGALRMRVKHSIVLPSGSWLLGCTFERELSEEELRGLL
jgi:hypothetical protein